MTVHIPSSRLGYGTTLIWPVTLCRSPEEWAVFLHAELLKHTAQYISAMGLSSRSVAYPEPSTGIGRQDLGRPRWPLGEDYQMHRAMIRTAVIFIATRGLEQGVASTAGDLVEIGRNRSITRFDGVEKAKRSAPPRQF